jgi:hypothetical protein
MFPMSKACDTVQCLRAWKRNFNFLYTVLIIADRSSSPFFLLNPDVRRMHANVADDNVLLVSSKSDEPQQQRRFELKTPPPKLPLLSSKRPA